MAVALALLVALVVWESRDWLNLSGPFLRARVPGWFYLLPVIWLFLSIELYDLRRAGNRKETLKGVAITAGLMLFVYLLIFFFAPAEFPRLGVGIFILAASVFFLGWRFLFISLFALPDFRRRALVVGAGRGGKRFAEVLHDLRLHPFHVVGYIDDDPHKQGSKLMGYPVLGGGSELLQIIEKEGITDVIFAITNEMRPELFQVLLRAEELGVQIATMPAVYEQLLGRVPIHLLQSDWVLRSFFDQVYADSFYEMVKRLLDIVGGLAGTILFYLTYPLFSMLIIADSGKPVLYHQTRLGLNGKEYEIIKYRTMLQEAEDRSGYRVTLPNDSRITRVGNLLRKSHLDELPQFLNVLRGEMSLVGPRAERAMLVSNLQAQVPFYRARLLVKPGITGWAQVNFGYAATVEDTAIKLEHDLYYIKHRNLWLDFVILLRTVGTVIGFRGQ